MNDTLEFEQWDRVEALLERLPVDEVVAVTVRDRTAKGVKEQPVGHLKVDDPVQMAEFQEEEDEDGWPGVIQAIRRFIHSTASENSSGAYKTTFRVQAWKPKGTHISPSTQFTVRDAVLGLGPDNPDMPIWPNPPETDAQEFGEAVDHAARRDLAIQYSQFGRYVLYATKQVNQEVLRSSQEATSMTRRSLSRLEAQNRELQTTLTTLTEAILNSRREALDTEAASLEARQKELARKELTASAGHIIKDTIETVVTGTTLPPEVKQLLPILNDPGMVEALKDEDLRKILLDPGSRTFAIDALKEIKKLMPAGAAQPTP